MIFRIAFFLAAVMMLILFSKPGHADYFERVAGLGCDTAKNKFVIRFGLSYNDDPIEVADFAELNNQLIPNWSSLKIQNGGECKLANGQRVFVSVYNGQPFPYGMDGGDPDAFFTLKMNNRDIYYYKNFYAGYGSRSYIIHAIIYDAAGLRECTHSRDEKTSQETPIICVDVSKRLEGNHLMADEKEAKAKDEKREELKKNLSVWCRQYEAEKAYHKIVSLAEKIYTDVEGYQRAKIDINNDGKKDEIYRIGGYSKDCIGCGGHYFDGSYLVAFTESRKKIKNFLNFIKKRQDIEEETLNIKRLDKWKAYFISVGLSGSSIRYVYNVPFVENGRTYIYSFETNIDSTPSAAISYMTPDNKIEILCKFP